MRKILINATNLHVGGGVQVASSFIKELAKSLDSKCRNDDYTVYCSSKVYENINDKAIDRCFTQFKIVDIFGWQFGRTKELLIFDGFDVCFTIFGPLYFKPKTKLNVMGFAQAWIAYPNNVAYTRLSKLNQMKNKLKFWLQLYYFKQSDMLVVEQEHVKTALISLGLCKQKISVISNTISDVYYDESCWRPLKLNNTSHNTKSITLGFIGRPYSHKNIEVLKEVDCILKGKYGIRVKFLFTFSQSEMAMCDFDSRDNFSTVGELTISQCPNFYKRIDALIFPSLLECFSVSPLEAMKMGTTVLASNYDFVKEVCGDSAYYFDPLDASSICNTVISAFSDDGIRRDKIEKGIALVDNFPTAKQRSEQYIQLLEGCLENIN
ncbi:hypothetical protein BCV02_05020 [Vibrio breoganii]|uniref:glycosyltransferase n=1 Tax=Vibrio breoganii TaxID=553239 RepID=UPI000C8590B2|nr:glycosyltransferase [Vibrio breoganii]PMG05087.1 hypothetical protein BCV02_05020 [Vibrio breoganii]